jgi:SPOR domain
MNRINLKAMGYWLQLAYFATNNLYKMKLLFKVITLLFATNYLLANDTIIVRKDPRLDVLTQKQAEINKRTSMMTSSGLYKGYRIQVISTTNRDEAIRVKTEVLTRFTDQKAYLTYHSPYFKVRIGNFIKKDEAEKFRQQLNKYYPQGVYVVEDAVEYTMNPDEIQQ